MIGGGSWEEAARAYRVLRALEEENPGQAKYQRHVREAVGVARSAIERYELHRKAEIEAAREESRAELERRDGVQHDLQQEVWTLKTELEAIKHARSSPKRTVSADETGSIIQFPWPKGSDSRTRHWEQAELEAVLLDLRTAGAEDGTEVVLSTDKGVIARVPYPEFIAKGGSTYATMQDRKREKPETWTPPSRPSWLVKATGWAVGGGLMLCTALKIFT